MTGAPETALELFSRQARDDERRAQAAEAAASAAANRTTGPGTAYRRVVDALDAGGYIARQGDHETRARCPAHDGDGPNLAVRRGHMGAVIKCHSRDCSAEEVAAALYLTMGDLFDEPNTHTRTYGIGGGIKRRLQRPGEDKRVTWERGTRPPILPLWVPELAHLDGDNDGTAALAAAARVHLAEGEKAADALALMQVDGCPASFGGTGDAGKVDLSPLAGKHVTVWPDNDPDDEKREKAEKAGLTVARRAREAGAAHVDIQRMPAGYGDAADLWETHGSDWAEHLGDVEPAAEASTPGYTADLYVDVAALLAHGPVIPPTPEHGKRDDGVGVFYKGQVNTLIGDPESGKTWLALAAAAGVLIDEGTALIVDLDHNGAGPTVSRLRALGVALDVLANPERFRYTAPEDADGIGQVVDDARTWRPDFVVLDSIGELLPLYGANSNSADDFTAVHAAALKPLAAAGACVVTIDHLAKGRESAEYGAPGTAAKKRAIGGTMLRVTVVQPFTPGMGGSAELTIDKDRHGGLRAKSGPGTRPLAGVFTLRQLDGGALGWTIRPPEPGETPSAKRKSLDPQGADTLDDLVDKIDALDPRPASANDAARRIDGRRQDVLEAFKIWLDRWHELTAKPAGSGSRPESAGTTTGTTSDMRASGSREGGDDPNENRMIQRIPGGSGGSGNHPGTTPNIGGTAPGEGGGSGGSRYRGTGTGNHPDAAELDDPAASAAPVSLFGNLTPAEVDEARAGRLPGVSDMTRKARANDRR